MIFSSVFSYLLYFHLTNLFITFIINVSFINDLYYSLFKKMAIEEGISVPLGIIEKWKDIDRTAFMDSIKELTTFKGYSIDPLTNIINIVTKVVKEISAEKT